MKKKSNDMKGGLKRISVSLFLGANLCTILLLWLCVALTFVPPGIIPRFSLLTLAFPVFLFVDALFFLFWLLFHARLAWVPIMGALVVGGYVLDYCPMNLGGKDSGRADDSTLTIITYNVGFMRSDEDREEMLRLLKTTDADIVCLQEVTKQFFARHEKWLNTTAYRHLHSGSTAILSRLPFLGDTIHIDYPTRTNNSMACWIDCYGDSLLIINNHLESNHLSQEEKDDYTHTIKEPDRENIKSSSHMLLGKLSEAASYRGAQTDSICAVIDRHADHDIIVCGDLNDTPVSYTYQKINRRLASAYRQAGFGPGFSFTRRSFPVRIDHLFFPTDWTCTSCCIDRTISISDHYPFIVRLRKKLR